MPFSKIHVPRSLPTETSRAINTVLHDSLVATCGAHPNDDFAVVVRYDADDMIFHPTFLGDRDPTATIVVEIALLGGRADEVKERFYADFRERLTSIDFDPNNSIVFLVENNPIDWSFSPAGSVKAVLDL